MPAPDPDFKRRFAGTPRVRNIPRPPELRARAVPGPAVTPISGSNSRIEVARKMPGSAGHIEASRPCAPEFLEGKRASTRTMHRTTSPSLLLPLVVLASVSASARARIGTPFSPPRLVNSPGTTDETADDDVALRFDNQGRLLAVYRVNDPNNGDSDIHFTKSRDQGTTWTSSIVAISHFVGDNADDREPYLSGDIGSFLVYASDRNQTAGEHDIF